MGTRYNKKYTPEFCDLLIEHLSKGLSYTTFGSTIGVVTSTLYEWENDHPEWKEAKDIAFQKSQEFFEKRLVAKVSGQKINGLNIKDIDTSCLIFALKTRYHACYGEKKETELTGEIKVSIDKDDARL